MKVQKTTTQPEFQPVELKITIESQEELIKLRGILKEYEDIANLLGYNNVLTGTEASFFETILRELQEAL